MRAACILTLFLLAFHALPADASPGPSLREPEAWPASPSPREDACSGSTPAGMTADGAHTLEDRVRRLEQIVQTKAHEKPLNNDSIQHINESADRHISLLMSAFNILAVFSGILAVAGIGITYFTTKSSSQEIEKYQKELEKIQADINNDTKFLQKRLAYNKPSETFSNQIIEYAKKAVDGGISTEALLGHAILAQAQRHWQDALMYWKNVLETAPVELSSKNPHALFGVSLAAEKLAEKARDGEKPVYFQMAEDALKKLSSVMPPDSSVLVMWGNLRAKRAECAVGAAAREYCFGEAEKKYAQAADINPDDAQSRRDWGALCAKRAQWAAPGSQERKLWLEEAEKKYHEATQKSPGDAQSWRGWGMVCLKRAEDAADPEERERLLEEAEKKYEKATQKSPGDAQSWRDWGALCAKRADLAVCPALRDRWLAKADIRYRHALRENPDDVAAWNIWGALCVKRGKNAASDERERFFAQAGRNYVQALDRAPHNADSIYRLACLEGLRGHAGPCAEFLEKLRELNPPVSADALDNEDFDPVRGSAEFAAFLEKVQ